MGKSVGSAPRENGGHVRHKGGKRFARKERTKAEREGRSYVGRKEKKFAATFPQTVSRGQLASYS